MTKHMEEVVECLKALRPEMSNAAGTRAIEELDWAIEQIEKEIAAVEAGGSQRDASRRSLALVDGVLRYLPSIVYLIRQFSE